MRYHNITKDDMLNGEGLRVVLWVSGCPHKCKGCHNPQTWDPESGIPFDEDAERNCSTFSAATTSAASLSAVGTLCLKATAKPSNIWQEK